MSKRTGISAESAWEDVLAYTRKPTWHPPELPPLQEATQQTRHRLLTLPRPTGMLLLVLTVAVVVVLLLPLAESRQHRRTMRYHHQLGFGLPPALPRALVASAVPNSFSNAATAERRNGSVPPRASIIGYDDMVPPV